jgi:hypothetical protein
MEQYVCVCGSVIEAESEADARDEMEQCEQYMQAE